MVSTSRASITPAGSTFVNPAIERHLGGRPETFIGKHFSDFVDPESLEQAAADQLEVVARVSLTGEPIAQSGDWFGQQLVEPETNASFDLVINQQVQ